MNILSKCFDEGLANNLVQLQLTYQCDDSILIAIGRHSKCLKMLDVSCSSTITVDGIKNFIFKVYKYIIVCYFHENICFKH
jgi:hypothetical protein